MLKFKSRNPKIRIPTFYLYYLPRTRRLMAGGGGGCEARRRGRMRGEAAARMDAGERAAWPSVDGCGAT